MTEGEIISPGDVPEPLRRYIQLLTPTGPVLSRSGAVVIALLLPALVPGPAALGGPVLLVATLVHRRLGNRLSWDRGVGVLGIAVALFSILTMGTAALFLSRAGWELGPASALYFAKPGLSVQIALVAALVFSVILHECAHGAAARISGDPTAQEANRLTLNPVPHIDLVGSIILPVVMIAADTGMVFGWAKPVPVNPARFRRPRLHSAFVSVAGIATNVALALAAGGLLLLTGAALVKFFPGAEVRGFTNMFAPVRLSGVPGPDVWVIWIEVLRAFVLVNLILATLNLLPIPPLDGFNILRTVLPEELGLKLLRASGMGMILLIVLIYTRTLDYVFLPAVTVAGLLGALPGMILHLP